MRFVPDRPLSLPLIPHSKTGVTSDGSIVAIQDQQQVTLQCNMCGAAA
jgi:hypothetical protein